MSNQQFASAVQAFADDLDNSVTMEDRKNAVQFLADKIGSDAANQIRSIFGLVGDYYKA